MTDKKHSVFVSSTFRDLWEARMATSLALLKMNCIPEAVELGAAASQSQWQAIQEIIDKCDYYVVIAGGRYGTIVPSAIVPNPDGISFTEMEYRHAKARKIPVLAFLHKSPESLLVGEKEWDGETDEKQGKFRAFRSLLETECKAGHWETTDQLRLEVATALPPLLAKSDRPGWVRGDLSARVGNSSEVENARYLKIQQDLSPLEIQILDYLSRPRYMPAVAAVKRNEIRDEFKVNNKQVHLALRNLLRHQLCCHISEDFFQGWGGDDMELSELGREFVKWQRKPR